MAQTSSVEIGPITWKGDLGLYARHNTREYPSGSLPRTNIRSLALPHALNRRVPENSYSAPLRLVQTGDVMYRTFNSRHVQRHW